jgi:RNA polymerase sigma-70 factor (ECF subfamily)
VPLGEWSPGSPVLRYWGLYGVGMLGSAEELLAVFARVAARDRSAFATLYDATSAKLYGVILPIMGERTSAEEVLQEVYVKIWQNAGLYDRAKASPITWMVAIARNRAIDEVRRRRGGPQSIDAVGELPDVFEDPLAGAERAQGLGALIRCLRSLEADKRNMILLAYYRGVSREELADRFDRPVATVKTWLRRGLLQLRDCLAS